MSHFCFKTYREKPKDAEFISHILLTRAGYIQNLSSGIFNFLPLGYRSIKRIENIIREEMDAIDCQELLMSVIVPAKLWKETGRYYTIKEELLRFKDRNEKDMVLSMTHEESITNIARNIIKSYKQLPMAMYQFQTKYRDEARPRGGIIRTREFIMKDAYSFHSSTEDLDKYYQKMYDAYKRIFKRCGCEAIAVESDTGMMGGKQAHEFMVTSGSGEDTIVVCSECDYAANQEVATTKREASTEEMLALEKIHTPNIKTITELAKFLNIPASKTAKCVFYKTENNDVVLSVVRGDLNINETKLRNYLKVELEVASDEEILSRGAVPGFASPIGLKGIKALKVVVDKSIANVKNLVAGANEKDYHLLNSNLERDFDYVDISDIAMVKDGDMCPNCGKKLKIQKSIEVGNIFKLGAKYSEIMKAYYLNTEKKSEAMIMGCYGIGLARLLGSVVELSHDERGIIMPPSISPFDVHIVSLELQKNQEIYNITEKVEEMLKNASFDFLTDDREESPGSKFADADLIGIPYRIIIGKKAVKNNCVELKIRKTNEIFSVPIKDIVSKLMEIKNNYW